MGNPNGVSCFPKRFPPGFLCVIVLAQAGRDALQELTRINQIKPDDLKPSIKLGIWVAPSTHRRTSRPHRWPLSLTTVAPIPRCSPNRVGRWSRATHVPLGGHLDGNLQGAGPRWVGGETPTKQKDGGTSWYRCRGGVTAGGALDHCERGALVQHNDMVNPTPVEVLVLLQADQLPVSSGFCCDRSISS